MTWHVFWTEVSRDVLAWSATSLVCSFSLCLHYKFNIRIRRTPGWLIFRATLHEMFVSIGFLSLYFCAEPETQLTLKEEWNRPHWLVLLGISFSEVAANAWRVTMFLHLVSIYRNPFNPERHRVLYPLSCLAAGLLPLAAVVWATAVVRPRDEKYGAAYSAEFFVIAFGFHAIPFLIFVGIGGLLHMFVGWMIRSSRTSGDSKARSISFLSRERAMRHGTAYLQLHGAQLAAGLVLSMLQLFTSVKNNMLLWHVQVGLTCGRGTITLLVWCFVNGYLTSDDADQSQQLAQPGRPGLGPRQGSLELVDVTVDASRRTGATTATNAAAGALMRSTSIVLPKDNVDTSHEIKKELRFELIYDVARSIGELAKEEFKTAERLAQENMLLSKRASLSAASQSAIFHHEQKRCLLGEIQEEPDELLRKSVDQGPAMHAVSSITRLAKHFKAADDSNIGDGPTQTVLAGASPSSSSTDCRTFAAGRTFAGGGQGGYRAEHSNSEQFQAIRKAFGISPEAYSRAFPNDLSELDPQWRKKLKESVSEGASGSFFYRVLSHSKSDAQSRFIVKQISWPEVSTLLGFLDAYTRHVTERNGRSLIQYFGCHAVQLRWKFGAKVNFVVMRNFLPVPMWLVFDLKGATANRRGLNEQLLHRRVGLSATQSRYGTLRDWEWMDTAMGVDVSEEHKQSLAETIAADCAFLSEQGLLDYSLLVGVHRLPADIISDSVKREKRVAELVAAGGYPSVDRMKVYFFGIIDVLERYSLRWQCQHYVLKMAYHVSLKGEKADGISAMEPYEYADRFLTFMHRELLRLPAAALDDTREEGVRGCCRRRAERGDQRWGKLWKRRRRGLVTEYIEAEKADYIRRIQELERQLKEAGPARAF